MRQNGATSAPFFYCVSYEILCETRIKPSFFGNCLIFLSSALGAQCLGSQFAPMAARSARAHREDSARARRGQVTLSALPWRAPPPKGEARLGSPFGGAGAVRRLRGQALALLPSFREATFSVRRRPGKTLRCFPSFFSGWRPLRARARSQPFLKKRRPKKLYARYRSAAPLTGCSLR